MKSESGSPEGFTLIELMITVAILAILAGIAYPSYVEYVTRSQRSQARSVLLEDAQFLERNFTESNKYHETSGGSSISAADLPASKSPKEGTAAYNIALDAAAGTDQTFVLTAARAGRMVGDKCGDLTINQLGQKSAVGATADMATCWGR